MKKVMCIEDAKWLGVEKGKIYEVERESEDCHDKYYHLKGNGIGIFQSRFLDVVELKPQRHPEIIIRFETITLSEVSTDDLMNELKRRLM